MTTVRRETGVAGDWRGAVNGVLYVVQFEPSLDDDAVVAERAEQLVAQPLFDQPVADTVAALRAGLASGEQLTGSIPVPHDEATVRTFLGRLVEATEALRPWPTPAYRKLPAHTRPDALDAPAVAELRLDWKRASDRLGRSIDRAGDTAVLVLQLDTGDVVAVVDDWDITPAGNPDGRSTLRSAGPGAPADVLAAFRTATGLSADEVVAL